MRAKGLGKDKDLSCKKQHAFSELRTITEFLCEEMCTARLLQNIPAWCSKTNSDETSQHFAIYITGFFLSFLFAFRVRACADVEIGLKREPTDDFDAYAISFGYFSGDVSSIIRSNDNTANRVLSIPAALHLSCVDFKKFWLKWADGYFYFGRGSVNNDILSAVLDDFGPRAFSTLYLRNLQLPPNTVEWEFQTSTGAFISFVQLFTHKKDVNILGMFASFFCTRCLQWCPLNSNVFSADFFEFCCFSNYACLFVLWRLF